MLRVDSANFLGGASDRRFLTGAGIAALVIGLAYAAPAMAQTDSAPAASEAGYSDEEIIVTARRREERLIDVPAAVTAIGDEELRNQRIQDTLALGTIVPGLNTQASTGNGTGIVTYTMRGLGKAATIPVSSVLVYQNEVRTDSANSRQIDMESVQVLKGPQGTLFGGTTTGGAVLYTTKRPSFDGVEGYAQASYGNLDYHEFEGALNLPISDWLAIRIAGDYRRRDGYINATQRSFLNPAVALSTVDLEDQASETVRVSVRLQPTSGITNDTIFSYSNRHVNGSAFVLTFVDQNPDCSTPGANLVCLFGVQTLNALLAAQQARGPFDIDNAPLFANGSSVPYQNRSRSFDVTNITTVEVADNIQFKNIFSYNWRPSLATYEAVDLDGTFLPPFEIVRTNAPGRNNDTFWTEEAQLSGDFDGLDVTAGVYLERGRNPGGQSTFVGGGLAGTTVFGSKDSQEAVYAQGTLNGSMIGIDKLSLTLGGRYSWNSSRADLGTFKSNAFTYTTSLDYKPTDETLVYIAHRKGYKPGGLNSVIQIPANGRADYAAFRPETVQDLEVGFKGRFGIGGDTTANIAIAAYQNWINDFQRTAAVNNLLSLNFNADKSKVKGVEIEAGLQVGSNFNIQAAIALTDAKFKRYLKPDFGNGGINDPINFVDLSGAEFAGVADTTISLRGTYDVPILPENLGKISFSAGLYYQSGTNVDDDNLRTPLAGRISNYTLLNARLGWRDAGGIEGLEVAGFIDNITDERYEVGGISVLVRQTGIANKAYGAPRTYGVEVRKTF
jgi:iron complex outermembrane receptor protein